MLEVIENLLILQDRDRKIIRARTELGSIEPQRQLLQSKLASTQAALDAAKLKVKQIETERKKLELEAESRKQQIEKYALQQFQTKKNEEFRALTHEIDTCKEAIFKLEDGQIACMEQMEKAQKDVTVAAQISGGLKKEVEDQITELGSREKSLTADLAGLESDRDALAEKVDEPTLARYERILTYKGDNVVVGVEHGVCGGCHMKLPTQILVSCRGHEEIVSCPNCGRILYYTRDMDLAVAE